MRTLLGFGLTFAAGALFFACAKGDDAATSDGGDGPGPGDDSGASEKDGATYGGGDGSAKDGGVDSGPACVETDAGCTTSLPGSCAAGIIHCDGGAPVCEPVSATAACFTGGATTRGNGICQDGVQSCSDTAGACVGEVTAAAHENCFNNLDDDCDGLINNGCPSTIALGTSRTLAGQGGGGGAARTVMCPLNAFVTRVDSWFDNSDSKASGVSIFCSTASLIQGASSYSVTLAANAPAPYGTEHGTASPTNQRTDDCGISGLTAITYTLGLADSWVEGQGSHCGTGALTLNADNTVSFSFVDATYTNGPYNAYFPNPPGTAFNSHCNANEVVVGFAIHDGAYMDNIAPICAPLVVTAKAGTPDP